MTTPAALSRANSESYRAKRYFRANAAGCGLTRPRALDLFCKAGGAAMGLYQAGFDVVGVDIEDQPRYPFDFVQADARAFLDAGGAEGFDFIWASPPYPHYSQVSSYHGVQDEHPDLIDPTRERLDTTGLPYVIENVDRAPLRNAIRLTGEMFNLGVCRPRLFEANFLLLAPSSPGRGGKRVGKGLTGVYGHGGGVHGPSSLKAWSDAMGIGWMTKPELANAIPPAYSEYIGRQVIDILERRGLTTGGAR